MEIIQKNKSVILGRNSDPRSSSRNEREARREDSSSQGVATIEHPLGMKLADRPNLVPFQVRKAKMTIYAIMPREYIGYLF
jgi:hypothetical protein